MEATLTLSQAGQQMGVEDGTLSRLIMMGALPEARQQPGPEGTVWVIPEGVLPSIAARNGWTIDLRGPGAAVAPPAAAQEPPIDPVGSPAPADPPSPVLVVGSGTSTSPGSNGALVPHDAAHPDGPLEVEVHPETDAYPKSEAAPSVAEVVDLALLDRLLGAQEQRVMAEGQVRETRSALAVLNQTHNRVTSELEVERHERMVIADRYREERLARAASDAKVTELRNRVTREMALAEAERQAKSEAMGRTIQAERDAANAVAAMGWLARWRFRRLNESNEAR